MARAHRPILAGGLPDGGAHLPILGEGLAGWRAPISRLWPGGWLGGAQPSPDSGRGASWVVRAHWPILAGGLAGWRASIGQFWPRGWLGGARPSAHSGQGAGWRAPIG